MSFALVSPDCTVRAATWASAERCMRVLTGVSMGGLGHDVFLKSARARMLSASTASVISGAPPQARLLPVLVRAHRELEDDHRQVDDRRVHVELTRTGCSAR